MLAQFNEATAYDAKLQICSNWKIIDSSDGVCACHTGWNQAYDDKSECELIWNFCPNVNILVWIMEFSALTLLVATMSGCHFLCP